MPYITILDFSTGEVHIHEYEYRNERNDEEIVEDLGYKTSNSQWLCTDKLKFQIHSIDEAE
jgi:hypothetical protein